MKSLQQFITENNIRVIKCEWVAKNPNNPEWRDATHYKVTLKCRGGKQITTYFSMGLAHTSEPEADDILNCFALDSSGIENNSTFDDWADEYGYNEDHDPGFYNAQTIYRACVTQAAKVKRWLGQEKYEELLWNVEGL